jgi:hypothetical protein
MPPARAAAAPAGRGGGGRGRGNGPVVGRGGSGRGQGRKASTKGLGSNAALAVQASLSDLLGPRRSPAGEQAEQEPTGELISWKYNRHDGGDKDHHWHQEEGGATWAGEDDGARAFEGDEAMDNLRAHPQWQI